jgi:hypothetical protein
MDLPQNKQIASFREVGHYKAPRAQKPDNSEPLSAKVLTAPVGSFGRASGSSPG